MIKRIEEKNSSNITTKWSERPITEALLTHAKNRMWQPDKKERSRLKQQTSQTHTHAANRC